jgi:hypothetical protein
VNNLNSIGFFPSPSIQGPARCGAPGGFAGPITSTGTFSLQAQTSFFAQTLGASQNLFSGWSSFGGGGFTNPGFSNPFLNPGFNRNFQNPGFNTNFRNPGFNMNFQNPGFNMNFQNPGFNTAFRNPGFENLIFAPGINSPFPQHPGFNIGSFASPGFGSYGGGHPGFGGGGHPGFSGAGHPGIANNALPVHLLAQGMPPIPLF